MIGIPFIVAAILFGLRLDITNLFRCSILALIGFSLIGGAEYTYIIAIISFFAAIILFAIMVFDGVLKK